MTRFSLLALSLCTFAGCDAGDKTETGTADDSCDVTVTTFPFQDSVDASYRGTIEFMLSAPDTTATITSDIAGTVTSNEDGTRWVLTPSAPLTPNSPYTATLNYCGGAVELAFTTSDLGTSLSDENILVGKTYELALDEARFVEPENVGQILQQYIGEVTIYIGVASVGGGKVQMVGALGNEDVPGTQAFCDPSIDFPEADFAESPHFVIGGTGKTTLAVAGFSIDIENLNIGGDFASDGSYFGGGTLSGTIDTRPLDTLVDEEAEEGYICDLAAGLGITCETCPSGGDFCLSLYADSILATEVSGLTLVEIDGNNCLGCNAGIPADTSETCPQEPE